MALRGRVGGTGVLVSFWFLAALVFAVWLGADAKRLLAAALIHEAGHLIALFLCGGRIESIELSLTGARIKTSPRYNLSAVRQALAVAAGPASGIFLAAFCGDKKLRSISLGLSLFNLLPLPGLDGGALAALFKTARVHKRR